MSDALRALIGIAADRPLTRAEAEAAFETLFEGAATPAQMGGLLMALRTRGETVDEFAAAATVMRAKCHRSARPRGRDGHRRHRRRRQGHAEHLDRHRLCGGGRGRDRGQARQPQPQSPNRAPPTR